MRIGVRDLASRTSNPVFKKPAGVIPRLRSQGNGSAERVDERVSVVTGPGRGAPKMSDALAAGLFPLVFVDPVKPSQVRRELVTLTRKGLEVADALIKTHASVI